MTLLINSSTLYPYCSISSIREFKYSVLKCFCDGSIVNIERIVSLCVSLTLIVKKEITFKIISFGV